MVLTYPEQRTELDDEIVGGFVCCFGICLLFVRGSRSFFTFFTMT